MIVVGNSRRPGGGSPAVTGDIIQSDVYSGEEQTCFLCNIKLLCIHPMKQSNSQAIVLYEMLLP